MGRERRAGQRRRSASEASGAGRRPPPLAFRYPSCPRVAPAWRFAPGHLSLAAGGTIEARNIGGETHTFTEVANFGGGCIGFLNGLLGLNPVPECAGFPGGLFGATRVPAGETRTVNLAPGVHRFECLIHPWMRTTIVVP